MRTPPHTHTQAQVFEHLAPVDTVLQVWEDMALLKEVHHLRLDLRAYRLTLFPFYSMFPVCG